MSTSGCNGTRCYRSLHIPGKDPEPPAESRGCYPDCPSGPSGSSCTRSRPPPLRAATAQPHVHACTQTQHKHKPKHTRTNKQKRAQSDLSPKHKFPAREPIPRGCALKIRQFGRTRRSSACALLTLLLRHCMPLQQLDVPSARTSPPVGGRENMGRSGRRIAGACQQSVARCC